MQNADNVTSTGNMETIELFAVEIYGNGRYYPGEVIYGDVFLKTNEELTLREIRVEFYGEAKVYWSEAARPSRWSKRPGLMRDYTNYEQYLNIAATAFGKGKGCIFIVLRIQTISMKQVLQTFLELAKNLSLEKSTLKLKRQMPTLSNDQNRHKIT